MADLRDIAPLLQDLCEYHGKVLPKTALVYYGLHLSGWPADIIRDGMNRWKHNNAPTSRLPSLAQLMAAIDEGRSRIWSKQKERENRAPITSPSIGRDPEYERGCWGLVRGAYSQTRAQLADAMEAMEPRWPGHGWAAAASRLRSQIALHPDPPQTAQPDASAGPGEEQWEF